MIDSRNIAQAWHERKVARMVANGTDEALARSILAEAKLERQRKRDERRRLGERIRAEERG